MQATSGIYLRTYPNVWSQWLGVIVDEVSLQVYILRSEKYLYTHKAIYSKVHIPGELKFSITFSSLYTIQPSINTERDITSINIPPKTKPIKEIKKIQHKLELHDKQLARAVDYAHKHPDESKAKVAKTFGVDAVTLRRRCKGKAIARQEQQLLTAGEEDAVAD